MKPWQHFKTITKRRWLVMLGCFRVGLYRQGLTHDLSKYSPVEFWTGARYYQGNRSPNEVERLEKRPEQYFAVLTGAVSVGVRGDSRSTGEVLALRAVTTEDFMTADWSRLPYELVAAASARITAELPEISRVVLDVTPKPPATVEWE